LKIRKKIEELSLISIIVLFPIFNISAQKSAQISIPFEIYDNAGGQMTLYFGLDQTATDGIDIHLGESGLPPYPPIGVFESRWILPENNFNGSLSSWSDYRFASGYPYSDTLEHRFRYQSADGVTAMNLGWNFPPEVTGLIQDLVNGTIVNMPISGIGTYEVPNFTVLNQLKLFVYYNNIVTSLGDEEFKQTSYYLEQNYPNPFNPSTTIKFSLPEATNVTLRIYNALGQMLDELVNTNLEAGWYNYQWDAANVASGIYIYELRTDNFVAVKKMILLH